MQFLILLVWLWGRGVATTTVARRVSCDCAVGVGRGRRRRRRSNARHVLSRRYKDKFPCELDLLHEASNLDHARALVASLDGLAARLMVPSCVRSCSTSLVMTQERLRGKTIATLAAEAAARPAPPSAGAPSPAHGKPSNGAQAAGGCDEEEDDDDRDGLASARRNVKTVAELIGWVHRCCDLAPRFRLITPPITRQ